ncbi:hypothetical protein KIPB_005968 [Kipferlia bialata]|uniref:PAP/OAS1 substrate-binding-related domain-containing protein n=1 Tax=Kipferlia bialata TaxID=797122 RepID=A0A9K3CY67_9EUKA|nr:hypothetical protein KIPB_005968 [Kipferlia bialata]|eukprot:g5968.t1
MGRYRSDDRDDRDRRGYRRDGDRDRERGRDRDSDRRGDRSYDRRDDRRGDMRDDRRDDRRRDDRRDDRRERERRPEAPERRSSRREEPAPPVRPPPKAERPAPVPPTKRDSTEHLSEEKAAAPAEGTVSDKAAKGVKAPPKPPSKRPAPAAPPRKASATDGGDCQMSSKVILETIAHFPWDTHAFTLSGPVALDLSDRDMEAALERPPTGPQHLVQLVSAASEQAGSERRTFLRRSMHIMDPFIPGNNLARSVSQATLHRLKRACLGGAATLAAVLGAALDGDLSAPEALAELDLLFVGCWSETTRPRPDLPACQAVRGHPGARECTHQRSASQIH